MAKADLHVHSKHSNRPSEWFLQKLGAAESYTEPETIYQLAKERGMTFVTITDHNEVAGSLELATKYPDAFSGVEATTYFPEDGCKVHLLIYGLNGQQFETVQLIRRDIYELRDFLVEEQLAHSLAHATYSVNGKLSFEHLEKLILLFDVFEAMNGGRSKSSNVYWYQYLKYLNATKFAKLQAKYSIKPQRNNSWIKGFTGGSDDHAGIFVGQTFTLAGANSRDDFLVHLRERRGFAKGRFNDFQSFAFAIYKIAHDYSYKPRHTSHGLSLKDIGGFVFNHEKMSLYDRIMLSRMKSNDNSSYKKHLAELVETLTKSKDIPIEKSLDLLFEKITIIGDEILKNLINNTREALDKGDIFQFLTNLSSSLPGMFLFVPFFSSVKHLHSNQRLLSMLKTGLPERENRKILWFTDTLNDLNGVSVTLKQLGWQFFAKGIDVQIVTSLTANEISGELPPNVINLPIVTTLPLPYYDQYVLKIPSFLRALKDLEKLEPEEIFISTPGPIGILGVAMGRLLGIKVTGVYHTDFTMELNEISGDKDFIEIDESAMETVEAFTRWFYSLMDTILVPTQAYIDILSERGLDRKKMSIFPRQINTDTFNYVPTNRLNGSRLSLPEGINLLYAGRVSKDKNLEFLIDVLKELRKHREDINLIVVGDGPFFGEMKSRLGNDSRVIFTGQLNYDALPAIYSQADAFVFPSITDTFGMVVLEAQCCELPAIVSDRGGPKEIIMDGKTGMVVPALQLDKWVNHVLEIIRLIEEEPEVYREMRLESRRNALLNSGWDTVMKNLTQPDTHVADAR